ETDSSTTSTASSPIQDETNAKILSLHAYKLNEQIESLKQQGADSALVSHLLENYSRIRSYLASNSVQEGAQLLKESMALAKTEQENISQRSNIANTFQDVQLGKDGSLMLQRAVSYNSMELYLTETPTGTRYSLVDQGREVVTSTMAQTPPFLLTEIMNF